MTTTASKCREPQRFASINDTKIAAPQRIVPEAVLRAQAGIPPDHVLMRDHNSPHDPVIKRGSAVDLNDGNVFYSIPECDVPNDQEACTADPKLSYSINDRLETTTRRDQTGQTLRDWFGLGAEVELFRDYESPIDEPISDDGEAEFSNGSAFITRPAKGLKIVVNNKPFRESDGVADPMRGRAIAALVNRTPDKTDVFRVKDSEQIPIGLDEAVAIANCDEFLVVRKHVQGGFQPTRIERELGLLRSNGADVTFVESPVPCVVYHNLPARPGTQPGRVDVLVPVPNGFPGAALDHAYLELGHLLIGRVAGAVQPGRITALGKTWAQISYHPHGNGGGPRWDKNLHGFHTYIDELITWLQRAN
jgi:hypothetical protein